MFVHSAVHAMTPVIPHLTCRPAVRERLMFGTETSTPWRRRKHAVSLTIPGKALNF